MKKLTRVKRYATLSNFRIVLTIGLGLASTFGVVAPETATRLRNEVLLPLGAITSATAGDL